MSNVYLDGKLVDGLEIDAKKHRYIGMFRMPYSEYFGNLCGSVFCMCGQVLHTYQETYNHWYMGHFDIPQYESLEKKEGE